MKAQLLLAIHKTKHKLKGSLRENKEVPYFVSLQEPWNPEPYKFHKEMESATKDCGVTSIDRDTVPHSMPTKFSLHEYSEYVNINYFL